MAPQSRVGLDAALLARRSRMLITLPEPALPENCRPCERLLRERRDDLDSKEVKRAERLARMLISPAPAGDTATPG